MLSRGFHHRRNPFPSWAVLFAIAFLLSATSPACNAQQPAPPTASDHPGSEKGSKTEVHTVTEDELKQQFGGKTLFLRGGYFDNELHFDEHGRFAGSSPQVSYTLSLIQIDKVHLSKRKVQFEGLRYGLHFLGSEPTQDPLQTSDKVRITPKKKSVKITIDRALVTAPKKKKKSKSDAKSATQPAPQPIPPTDSDAAYTMSKAQANDMLKEALDHVFSKGLDDRMVASLPDFWQLYFKAAAKKSTYLPEDPSILHQSDVEQKARLLSTFEPPSNDLAQTAGVAGLAQYRVVVQPDGKPGEVAVGRPIGFGLDENAVASIRKATFQPAMKNGKPVPVVVDLLVQFRIYSKRTGASNAPAAAASLTEQEGPSLPGPYSAGQTPIATQQ